MKRTAIIVFIAAMLALSPALAGLADAKSGGSSGGSRSSSSSSRSSFSSGSSSSSSSSSSGSWSSSGSSTGSKSSSSSSFSSGSKPDSGSWSSSSGQSVPTTGSSGSGASGSWSSSSGTSVKTQSGPASSGSSFSTAGASGIRKESSLKAYGDYTSRFGKSGNPAGSTGQPLINPNRTWSSYSDYRTDRDRYYSGIGWRPPSYVYMSYPSFGFWDSMFLWMLLSHSNGSNFYYNNQNDPGVRAWREEADKLAQSNADLKKQLADMDVKLDQMRKDGVAAKPGQIPEGLDPSMAYAADKVVKENQEEPQKSSGWTGVAIFGVIAVAIGGLLVLRRFKTT